MANKWSDIKHRVNSHYQDEPTSQKVSPTKTKKLLLNHKFTVQHPFQLGFYFTLGVLAASIVPIIVISILLNLLAPHDRTIPYQSQYQNRIQQTTSYE